MSKVSTSSEESAERNINAELPENSLNNNDTETFEPIECQLHELFAEIPIDCLIEIFSFIERTKLIPLRLVSKEFKQCYERTIHTYPNTFFFQYFRNEFLKPLERKKSNEKSYGAPLFFGKRIMKVLRRYEKDPKRHAMNCLCQMEEYISNLKKTSNRQKFILHQITKSSKVEFKIWKRVVKWREPDYSRQPCRAPIQMTEQTVRMKRNNKVLELRFEYDRGYKELALKPKSTIEVKIYGCCEKSEPKIIGTFKMENFFSVVMKKETVDNKYRFCSVDHMEVYRWIEVVEKAREFMVDGEVKDHVFSGFLLEFLLLGDLLGDLEKIHQEFERANPRVVNDIYLHQVRQRWRTNVQRE